MTIRRIPKITAEQESLRLEQVTPGNDQLRMLKRNPVKPVPEGSIVLKAFLVTGYAPDCDGSLMARLENIDAHGEPTGWDEERMWLNPESTWTADSVTDLDASTDTAPSPEAHR